jgi:hypothetical protein
LAVELSLTDENADLLVDVISFYLEGHEEAERQVQEDRTHETIEAMMRASDDMRQTRIELLIMQDVLRRRLQGEVV